MNAVMTVDLSELDAWSAQVQRASDDLTGIARNGGNSLVQSDFGPILETMMGAYNSLLPSVNQSLEDNGTGMGDHAEALRPLIPPGMTMPELALRWILADSRVATIIPGMRKKRHVEANTAVSDGKALGIDLLNRLNAHRWDRSPTSWSQ